jgi:hypothetical protein
MKKTKAKYNIFDTVYFLAEEKILKSKIFGIYYKYDSFWYDIIGFDSKVQENYIYKTSEKLLKSIEIISVEEGELYYKKNNTLNRVV